MKKFSLLLKDIFYKQTSKIPIQFLRFSLIGVINTLVDLGVLNLLSYLTGIYKGKEIIILNTISYLIATVNSYFLNKYWTFGQRVLKRELVKFSKFLIINLTGMLFNSFIVYFLTTHINMGFKKELWMNVSKIFATLVVMIYNFILYRFIVFQTKVVRD